MIYCWDFLYTVFTRATTPNVTTLYNMCAVPWGYHDKCGDILSTVGDIISTVGDIMSTMGVIFSTVGVFSTVGDVMSTVGDIMSTMGVILCTVGCSVPWGISQYTWRISWVPWGENLLLFEYPHGTEHPPWYSCYLHMYHDIPHMFMISPHMYHDIPHGTQITKDGILPRYWTPPWYSWYPPTCIMIFPHGTEYSSRYSR